MKPLATKEKIRRAAMKLFERGGADAVSMRRVAQAAGITPMAIYRHFSSREALLKQLSDDSFQVIAREWQTRATQPEALLRLPALLTPYLDYALQHPHLFDHAFSLRRDDARQFPEDFRNRQSPTLNVIADAIAEGIDQGVLRRDDPWSVAMTLWAHSHGLIALYRAGRFSYDEAQFRAFYLESLERLIDGIKA
ncbi:TetR/AcrR family transcriptional regulator [Rhodanobacter ginsengiterrae]|uniref:TetR/AcrR family transcriptional regulator n=1 Tax=Rhodanobacter ginsengiterrae TaxID=2008451 RepID=UPI003CE93919